MDCSYSLCYANMNQANNSNFTPSTSSLAVWIFSCLTRGMPALSLTIVLPCIYAYRHFYNRLLPSTTQYFLKLLCFRTCFLSTMCFLQILVSVPEVVRLLRAEKSKSSLQCLSKLSELLHCLMNLHAGFPELYDPVLDLMKVWRIPLNISVHVQYVQLVAIKHLFQPVFYENSNLKTY